MFNYPNRTVDLLTKNEALKTLQKNFCSYSKLNPHFPSDSYASELLYKLFSNCRRLYFINAKDVFISKLFPNH